MKVKGKIRKAGTQAKQAIDKTLEKHPNYALNRFLFILGALLLLAGMFYLIYMNIRLFKTNSELEESNTELEQTNAELNEKISGYMEKDRSVVNTLSISEKLSAVSELTTYAVTYSGETVISNAKSVFGVDLPFTTHSIEMKYTGVIKLGYDLTEVISEVDYYARTVKITLPLPEVLDNYLIMDRIQCTDNNNIFNPIVTQELIDYCASLEEQELMKATENGIYADAEQQMELIIREALSSFDGYKIVFVPAVTLEETDQ